MATCHRSRNSGSSQARSRTKDILARIDTNGLRQGALTITCWRSVGSFPVPSGFNNMFCVDLRAALAYLLRLLPWDWTCTVGGKWEDIWWEKNLNATETFRCSRQCWVKKSTGWTLERHFRTQTGTKAGGCMFDLEGYFPLEFSYSVVRASVHGNPLKIPYETAVDLCRDDFPSPLLSKIT